MHHPLLTRSSQFLITLAALVAILLFGGSMYAGWRLAHPLDGPRLINMQAARSALADVETAAGFSGFLGSLTRFTLSQDSAAVKQLRSDYENLAQSFTILRGTAPATEPIQELETLFDNYRTTLDTAESVLREQQPPQTLQPALQNLTALQALVRSNIQRVEYALDKTEISAWQKMLFWLALAGATLSVLLVTTLQRATREQVLEPLQQLQRSLNYISQSDSKAPLWGTERADMIGDLARSIDLARYRFTEVPDITLVSDQGPVRMKFEGRTSSLFEAVMQSLRDGARQLHTQSAEFNETIKSTHTTYSKLTQINLTQQQVLTYLTTTLPKFDAALNAMQASPQALEQHLKIGEVLVAAANESKRTTTLLGHEAQTAADRLQAATELLSSSGEVLAEHSEATRGQLEKSIAAVQTAEQTIQRFMEHLANRFGYALDQMETLTNSTSPLNADTKQQFSAIMSILMDIAEQMRSLNKHQQQLQLHAGAAGQQQVQRALLGMGDIYTDLKETKSG